jgi:hypothetical protein
MKFTIAALLSLSCSSHASNMFEGDDSGSIMDEASVEAARDAAEHTDVEEDAPSSGDSELPPGGLCPVLLASPCEPKSCSGTCACNNFTQWECITETNSTRCYCSGVDD